MWLIIGITEGDSPKFLYATRVTVRSLNIIILLFHFIRSHHFGFFSTNGVKKLEEFISVFKQLKCFSQLHYIPHDIFVLYFELHLSAFDIKYIFDRLLYFTDN